MTINIQADDSSVAALYIDYIEKVTMTDGTAKIVIEGLKPKEGTKVEMNGCAVYFHPHTGNCRCLKLCRNCGQPKAAHS